MSSWWVPHMTAQAHLCPNWNIVFRSLGNPLSGEKTGPDKHLEFLGIALKAIEMKASLPAEKLQHIYDIAKFSCSIQNITKQQLLSLLRHAPCAKSPSPISSSVLNQSPMLKYMELARIYLRKGLAASTLKTWFCLEHFCNVLFLLAWFSSTLDVTILLFLVYFQIQLLNYSWKVFLKSRLLSLTVGNQSLFPFCIEYWQYSKMMFPLPRSMLCLILYCYLPFKHSLDVGNSQHLLIHLTLIWIFHSLIWHFILVTTAYFLTILNVEVFAP